MLFNNGGRNRVFSDAVLGSNPAQPNTTRARLENLPAGAPPNSPHGLPAPVRPSRLRTDPASGHSQQRLNTGQGEVKIEADVFVCTVYICRYAHSFRRKFSN